MDLLLSFIEGVGLSASILSLAWLWRSGRIHSVYGLAAIVILAFMMWQFVSLYFIHDDPVTFAHQLDSAIVGLFGILAAGFNTYLGGRPKTQINIGVDRRKSNVAHYPFNGRERRQTPSHSLHS